MSKHGMTRDTSVPPPQPDHLHHFDDHREATEVRVYWQDTLLQTSHLCPPRPFVLGTGRRADLRLDGELLAQHQVSIPSQPGKYEVAGLTLVVTRVAAARRLPMPLVSIDWRQQGWTLASFAACAAFLLAVALMPPNASALSLQRLNGDERYLGFDYLSPPVVIDVPEPLFEMDEGGGQPGEPAPGEPGQSGDAQAERSHNRRADKGRAQAFTMTREALIASAADTGILGALRAQARTLESGRYVAATAMGADPANALVAILGDLLGPNRGHGGLGMIGTGRGQVAGALGTRGVGALGTHGSCMGPHCAGSGSGIGTGVGGLHRRTPRVPPPVTAGRAQVTGSLSKETIRRIISRQLKQVRFCYEQGLQRRPDLAGRVAVSFIIGPSGAVRASAVSRSTLGDPRAAQCIAKVIGRLTFPAPGGIVSVKYPFTLQTAGR